MKHIFIFPKRRRQPQKTTTAEIPNSSDEASSEVHDRKALCYERARKNASALNSRSRTKREIGLRPSRVSQVRRWWEKGSDDTKIIDFIYLAVRGCSFFRGET
jgi:hypothetical protein